jgi:hypothetical protein
MNGLAVRTPVIPSDTEWQTMMRMAGELVKSGMLPQHIKTPAAAVAIMQKGKELGIAPMYAMSNIAVIQGKPTANSELMLALIFRDHGDDAVIFEESTAERCTVSYKRRNATRQGKFTFTIQEAKQAGLQGGNWSKYPAAMLRARCVSAVARMGFPDSIGGMYTPEELGQSEDAEGEIIVVNGQDVNPTTGEIVTIGEPIETPVAEVLSPEESLGHIVLGRTRDSAARLTSNEPASDKVVQHVAGLLFDALGDEDDCDRLVRAIFGNGINGLTAEQASFIDKWAANERFKKQANAALKVAKAEQVPVAAAE